MQIGELSFLQFFSGGFVCPDRREILTGASPRWSVDTNRNNEQILKIDINVAAWHGYFTQETNMHIIYTFNNYI